jgi:hypothetical protein
VSKLVAKAVGEYVAGRSAAALEQPGTMCISRHLDRIYIEDADPRILVAMELVEWSDPELITFESDSGVMAFHASNETVRYRVVGRHSANLDNLVCERIDEED